MGLLLLNGDKNDPRWNFMNGLTSQEITDIVVKAIKEQLDGRRLVQMVIL